MGHDAIDCFRIALRVDEESELRKVGDGKADLTVTAWVSAQDSRDLYISAITILELERGILSIKRRDPAQGARLRTWMASRVRPEFA